MHVFEFLDGTTQLPPVCVLYGNEPFFTGLARRQVVDCFAVGDRDFPYASLDGNGVSWRDVADELATVSLFGGGRRLVLIQGADSFVSAHRDRLEVYVENPCSASVLVLEVENWQRTTRLFKALDATGLQVECRAPEKTVGRRKVLDAAAVRNWLVKRGAQAHGIRLAPAAADLLFELVGPEFGLLDQELAKLALLESDEGKVTVHHVGESVGGGRAKSVWELVDQAAEGQSRQALEQLELLLQAGEHPLSLFAQMSWMLRRLAAATRIYEEAEGARRQGGLSDALIEAGIPHWNRSALSNAERQLKHLGRDRAGRLFQWLLETDLALKGTHSAPGRARLALELLLLRLAPPPPGGIGGR